MHAKRTTLRHRTPTRTHLREQQSQLTERGDNQRKKAVARGRINVSPLLGAAHAVIDDPDDQNLPLDDPTPEE